MIFAHLTYNRAISGFDERGGGMVTDEEKRFGFRWRSPRIEPRIELVAAHYSRRRMPRAAEFVQAVRRGREVTTIVEVEYEWVVLLNGRRVGRLRLTPGGALTSGRCLFPRSTLIEAAEAIVKSHPRG